MVPPPDVHTLPVTTSDGLTLEAELVAAPEPTAAAVVCHPHPLYGGSMHNNVVHRLVTDLPGRGVSCVRFNFRGAGASQGSHGGGEAERADVVAAVDALADRYPGLPIVLMGYSFGADVSLAVADDRISGWLAVSPPLRIVAPEDMGAAADPRPTVIVTGTADDFRPASEAEAMVAGWTNTRVVAAAGVDHFWMQGLELLGPAADELLDELGVGR